MQNVEIITRSNMAACSDSLSLPSWDRFCQCVQSVCKVFDVSSLQERQLQALYSFVLIFRLLVYIVLMPANHFFTF